jgi:hypothetical protein
MLNYKSLIALREKQYNDFIIILHLEIYSFMKFSISHFACTVILSTDKSKI